mmetsp:Transcript_108700/g.306325  ORF Transcript_108700/g.306325 Transcript_108700/m.306325 type:complete len:220 (-) Transcript_108700:6-665(-)
MGGRLGMCGYCDRKHGAGWCRCHLFAGIRSGRWPRRRNWSLLVRHDSCNLAAGEPRVRLSSGRHGPLDVLGCRLGPTWGGAAHPPSGPFHASGSARNLFLPHAGGPCMPSCSPCVGSCHRLAISPGQRGQVQRCEVCKFEALGKNAPTCCRSFGELARRYAAKGFPYCCIEPKAIRFVLRCAREECMLYRVAAARASTATKASADARAILHCFLGSKPP